MGKLHIGGRHNAGRNLEKESEGETDEKQKFDWNEESNEITLQPLIFKFNASPKDKKPDLNIRRGAARDRYGNWFWIDETGTKIKVLSVGSKTVSDFYPTGESDCEEVSLKDFEPLNKNTPTSIKSFRGIAVTIVHFLVVGTVEPAGLLIFDLFSTGEPRQILWREDAAFVPFDISARFCGGAVVLDRENKRFWTLDRTFSVVGELPTLTEEYADEFQPFEKADVFQPVNESEEERKFYEKLPAEKFYSELSSDQDPISIEALPDETVLILNLAKETDDFSIIDRYFRGRKIDELSTASIKNFVTDDDTVIISPPKKFRLRGYDIAFVKGSDADETRDRLFSFPKRAIRRLLLI